MKKVLLTSLLGLALLLACSSISVASQEAISAADLFRAYQTNTPATKEKYLNKTIQINGVVVQTYMSRYMTPNVDLSDRANGDVMAICVLSRLDMGKLSNYTPGQTAAFSGRVHAFGENRVIIKDTQPVE